MPPEELDALPGDLELFAGWLMVRGIDHHGAIVIVR
jgi:hypothetical protein